MKTIVCLLAGVICLTSFNKKQDEKIDGIWTGYYKTDRMKERMMIRFGEEDKIEFYAGRMQEEEKCNGSYRLMGSDSISFKYTTADGREFVMKGEISYRKDFVEGVWRCNESRGKFYLEKREC